VSISRVLLFERTAQLDEGMIAKGFDNPFARAVRNLSSRHWIAGTILQVAVQWGVFFVVFDLLTGGKIQHDLIAIVLVAFAVSLPWFMFFNRWRAQNGRE
jgi:hypothetical protein